MEFDLDIDDVDFSSYTDVEVLQQYRLTRTLVAHYETCVKKEVDAVSQSIIFKKLLEIAQPDLHVVTEECSKRHIDISNLPPEPTETPTAPTSDIEEVSEKSESEDDTPEETTIQTDYGSAGRVIVHKTS